MNEVFQFTLIILALAMCLAAFFAVLAVFFPNRITRTRAAFEASPGRALFTGLINALFFGAIALVLASASGGGSQGIWLMLAFLVLAGPVSGMCLGLAALVQFSASRMVPQAGLLAGTAVGTVSLSLASAVPIVGWFLLLPFLLLAGLGSFVISLMKRDL